MLQRDLHIQKFFVDNCESWIIMSILAKIKPQMCAGIAIDCLNTFMKPEGFLSISTFQKNALGQDGKKVQTEIDAIAKRTGELRCFLYDRKIPQMQLQDAHVVESIHGKRFHSLEIVREGEEPDFLRTFPKHALLEKNLRFGTEDQQPLEEIAIPAKHKIIVRWFDSTLSEKAVVEPQTELIFLKDDFAMFPGTPFVHKYFWELRRQGRFYLIVFGVCDEICNLRNVLLMLAAIFNVIYVEDCTYPLDPNKRNTAITYMRNFNPLGSGAVGQFETVTAKEVIEHFQAI